ncbi:MAG: hypothetical protein A3F67_02950 [Verrucomicrobia bacterium RIFCSPHIGHO2_12_FULL_41_10]|nr:MAG: hypothetical protein A3F67_02950 [Verrucomicrobia bacterium RIFCSPHIGHO2_12_FULL_41_10]
MKWSHWILLAGLCSSSLVFAANNQPIQSNLILNQIKVIKEGDWLSDDLYFDISVLRANRPTQYIRLPEFPLYWPASQVNALKSTVLWSEPIKSGQKIILIVSLMDQDSKPLNPDDVIGLIRVELKNEKGDLHMQWSMPNQKSVPVNGTINTIQKFELFNVNGHYEVYLSLH